MAEENEIQIPGTKSKLPTKWLLIGGLVVVAFVILSKGGGQDEEGDGMLASELDQRLGEQWNAIQQALEESKQQGETTAPVTPPETPVEPVSISQPSSKGSKTPWRGNKSGSVSGINLRDDSPLGQPARVEMRSPSTETFYKRPETAEQKKKRLLEREKRSPTLNISTPVIPRETPAQKKARLLEREKRSPTLNIKTSTSTNTKIPAKKKPTQRLQRRR